MNCVSTGIGYEHVPGSPSYDSRRDDAISDRAHELNHAIGTGKGEEFDAWFVHAFSDGYQIEEKTVEAMISAILANDADALKKIRADLTEEIESYSYQRYEGEAA